MKLHAMKLVTIVAEGVLKERLVHAVLELGATGCTYQPAQGIGSRSARHDDMFSENFQLEVVCPRDVAEAIMSHLSQNYFSRYAMVAWMSDVEVMRGSNYTRT